MIKYIKVKTKEQLCAVSECKMEYEIIADYKLTAEIPAGQRSGVWLSLPDVLRENKLSVFEELCASADGFKGVVIHNADELGMLRSAGYGGLVMAGELLYAYNSEAVRFYQGFYPDMRFIAPAELTDAELVRLEAAAKIRFIYKIYGHQQLMTTAQVLDGPFRDEKGESYIGIHDPVQDLSQIYTGRPVSMLDKQDVWQDRDVLIEFTFESGKMAACILKEMNASGYIRGHHFKGID